MPCHAMPCKASLCTRSALATALAADLSGRAHAKRAQGQRGEAQGVRHTARTVARVCSTMLPHSLCTRRVPCDSPSIGAGTCYVPLVILHVGWHVLVACCMLDGTCMLHVAWHVLVARCKARACCLFLVCCCLLHVACTCMLLAACCMTHACCMARACCMLHQVRRAVGRRPVPACALERRRQRRLDCGAGTSRVPSQRCTHQHSLCRADVT